MLRRCLPRKLASEIPLPVHRDTDKRPQIVMEVGTWLYKKETMTAFQQWCKEHQCRAYGNVRMTSTVHFARCLRASKELAPGQAIITCPVASCFNYLVVAREMFNCSFTAFPIQLNWMNYNDRLSYLKSGCMFEFAQAGWMTRIASLEDSPYTPYIHFLLEDTRGKEGISNGIAKEREDAAGVMDHILSEMATDACEEPETFLANFFCSLSCLHLRSQPIEPAAIESFIPGTNFFKAKVAEMYVPTLMPLIDCVPQMEDASHNTIVEFFPYQGMEKLKEQCKELQLPFFEHGASPILQESADGQPMVNLKHELMDPQLLREGGGFFALRAITVIEEGDVLYLRRFSREGGDTLKNEMNAQVTNATRILSRE